MRDPVDLRDAVIEALMEGRQKGLPIMVVLSDSVSTSKITPFQNLFPDDVVNVGIAEQNLVGMAAGISLAGDIAITANAAPFLLHRSYEQVKIDICYNRTNVKLLGINAGIAYGQLGSTHHAIDDISIIRNHDNIQIFAPGDAIEAKLMMEHALEYNGPVYIRLDNIKVEPIHDDSYQFVSGAVDVVRLGSDVLICSLGTLLPVAFHSCLELERHGMASTLANISSLRPLDREALIRLLRNHKRIVTLEEHSLHGGLASIIQETIATEQIDARIVSIGIPEGATTLAGSREELRTCYGLDVETVVRTVEHMVD